MRLDQPRRFLLACLGLLLTTALLRADAPPDPVRLVPEQADLLLEVHHPRQLVEGATTLDLVNQLRAVDQVRELLDSTTFRRFYQIVTYFEKQLGTAWPEMLDRLAGGGVVLAAKQGDNPGHALLVIQGKDAELTKKFAHLGLDVLEQELARQDLKAALKKGSYRGLETAQLGNDFHAAIAEAAILVSNREEVLHAAVDLHLDGGKKSLVHTADFVEARKLLPSDVLASAYLSFGTLHKSPAAKDLFEFPRTNPVGNLLTILFGGYADVVGRAPFICAGLVPQKDGLVATIRMPRGREGMSPVSSVHLPPPGQPGSLPLLEPKDVMFSSSFFVDISKFWDDRAKLFAPEYVKILEEFDKNAPGPLGGNKVQSLLTMTGAYHRVVVANQANRGYKIAPKVILPAFAVVVEERDPEAFSKTAETALRAAALLASTQVRLKLTEEKHGDLTLVGYRFPENVKVKQDVNDVRFNLSPCFFSVGKFFVASSTLELGHELADLLQKEQSGSPAKADPATVRSQAYGRGGADFLTSVEDVLLTQAILDQALTPEAAREQVHKLLALVRKLGVVKFDSGYGDNDFHYDARLILGK
jgi:hypothetical protein